MLRPLLLLALAFALAHSAQGQEVPCSAGAAVAGIVRYAVDDLPIPGAFVVLGDSLRSGETDLSGAFRFDCIPPGTYDVKAQFIGMVTATRQVTALAGGIGRTVFVLEDDESFGFYHHPADFWFIDRDPFRSRRLWGEEIQQLPIDW